MYQRSKLTALALFLGVFFLWAQGANVAGKWSGIILIDDPGSGDKIETPVELDLVQNGAALAGKIGRAGDPERVDIRNGKMEGNLVTFEASSVEVAASMRFSLTVEGERLRGEMRGSAEGKDIVAKVTLSRVK